MKEFLKAVLSKIACKHGWYVLTSRVIRPERPNRPLVINNDYDGWGVSGNITINMPPPRCIIVLVCGKCGAIGQIDRLT